MLAVIFSFHLGLFSDTFINMYGLLYFTALFISMYILSTMFCNESPITSSHSCHIYNIILVRVSGFTYDDVLTILVFLGD